MTEKIPRVRIFSPWAETFNLLLPLFFFFFILAVWFLGAGEMSQESRNWMVWGSSYLGLNIIHNAFSISILLLPEVRAWLREKSAQSGRSVGMQWAAVGVLLLLVFQLYYYLTGWRVGVSSAEFDRSLVFVRLMIVVQAGIGFGHLLLQSLGVSMLYNQKNSGNSTAEAVKVQRLRKLERALYRVMAVAASLIFGLVFAGYISANAWIYFIALLLLALALNVIAFFYPRWKNSNKPVYQLRLFLVPLGLLFPWAMIGSSYVHGIESGLVFNQMVKRSTIKNRRRLGLVVVVASVMVGIFALPRPGVGVPRLNDYLPGSYAAWLPLLAVFSSTLTFFHYYVESQIFHFSDPVTRKNISPLLQ